MESITNSLERLGSRSKPAEERVGTPANKSEFPSEDLWEDKRTEPRTPAGHRQARRQVRDGGPRRADRGARHCIAVTVTSSITFVNAHEKRNELQVA